MIGDKTLKENCELGVLGGSLKISRQWERKRRCWIKYIFKLFKSQRYLDYLNFFIFSHCICLLATEGFLLSTTLPQTKQKK